MDSAMNAATQAVWHYPSSVNVEVEIALPHPIPLPLGEGVAAYIN